MTMKTVYDGATNLQGDLAQKLYEAYYAGTMNPVCHLPWQTVGLSIQRHWRQLAGVAIAYLRQQDSMSSAN